VAMAIAYAQYISCRNRTETDSCGVCPSCHKYNKLAHPDLHFVFPIFNSPKTKNPVSDDFIGQWREMVLNDPYFDLGNWLSFIEAENAQGLIYERESDSIFKKLNLKSFESEFKVMIIWLPEKMHVACANKLLKLIEEPPNKTLFILITEDEEAVISTIRSRAQLIKFPFIDKDSMKDALLEMEGIDRDLIPDAVHLANGNFTKAKLFINPSDDELFYFQKFQDMMRQAYKREVLEQIQWANEMAGIGRDKQKAFFAFALRMIREYFVMNMKQSEMVYLNQKEKAWGKQFAPFINERNIVPFFNEFEKGITHISWNGNPRIIFLDTALRMVRLIKR
jgi:DNA polymerase-3 subunit delta'